MSALIPPYWTDFKAENASIANCDPNNLHKCYTIHPNTIPINFVVYDDSAALRKSNNPRNPLPEAGVTMSSYDLLYKTVAHAESSIVQFPSTEANFGMDPRDTIDRAVTPDPEMPPKRPLTPRLRRMASFNGKRDILSSPFYPTRRRSCGSHTPTEEIENDWGSPAPKKSLRSSSSTERRVAAGIEIVVTPPTARPDLIEFSMTTASNTKPSRRRRVYDNAYLSPSYSGARSPLRSPSSSSSSSKGDSSARRPHRCRAAGN